MPGATGTIATDLEAEPSCASFQRGRAEATGHVSRRCLVDGDRRLKTVTDHYERVTGVLKGLTRQWWTVMHSLRQAKSPCRDTITVVGDQTGFLMFVR